MPRMPPFILAHPPFILSKDTAGIRSFAVTVHALGVDKLKACLTRRRVAGARGRHHLG